MSKFSSHRAFFLIFYFRIVYAIRTENLHNIQAYRFYHFSIKTAQADEIMCE